MMPHFRKGDFLDFLSDSNELASIRIKMSGKLIYIIETKNAFGPREDPCSKYEFVKLLLNLLFTAQRNGQSCSFRLGDRH